ncbi:hypothetical protein J5T34_07760, partial [Cupriavidus gilardii]|uniref:hypothetical protein n=1 Tax=Cupriavidus gilardii TaxID=82541 RepID=UPI001ABE8448
VTAFGHLLDRLGPELIRISLAFHASSSLKNTLSGVYKTGDVPRRWCSPGGKYHDFYDDH